MHSYRQPYIKLSSEFADLNEWENFISYEIGMASNKNVPSGNRKRSYADNLVVTEFCGTQGNLGIKEINDSQRKIQNFVSQDVGSSAKVEKEFPSSVNSFTDIKAAPYGRDLEEVGVTVACKQREAEQMTESLHSSSCVVLEQEVGNRTSKVKKYLCGNLTLILPDENIHCSSKMLKDTPQHAEEIKYASENVSAEHINLQNEVLESSEKEDGEITSEQPNCVGKGFSCEENRLGLKKGTTKIQLKCLNPDREGIAKHTNQINARFNVLLRDACSSVPKYGSFISMNRYQPTHFDVSLKYGFSKNRKLNKPYSRDSQQTVNLTEASFMQYNEPSYHFLNPVDHRIRTEVEVRSQAPGEHGLEASLNCRKVEITSDSSLCYLSNAAAADGINCERKTDCLKHGEITDAKSNFLEQMMLKKSSSYVPDCKTGSETLKYKECEEIDTSAETDFLERQEKFKKPSCSFSPGRRMKSETKMECEKQRKDFQRNREKQSARDLVRRQLEVISSHVDRKHSKDYEQKASSHASDYVSEKGNDKSSKKIKTKCCNSPLIESFSFLPSLEKMEADIMQKIRDKSGHRRNAPFKGNSTPPGMLLNYKSEHEERKVPSVRNLPLKLVDHLKVSPDDRKLKHYQGKGENRRESCAGNSKNMTKYVGVNKMFSPKLTQKPYWNHQCSSNDRSHDKQKNYHIVSEDYLNRYQAKFDTSKKELKSPHCNASVRKDCKDEAMATLHNYQGLYSPSSSKLQYNDAKSYEDSGSKKYLDYIEMVNPSENEISRPRRPKRKSCDTYVVPKKRVYSDKRVKGSFKKYDFQFSDYLETVNSSVTGSSAPKPNSTHKKVLVSQDNFSQQKESASHQQSSLTHEENLDGENLPTDDSARLLQNYFLHSSA